MVPFCIVSEVSSDDVRGTFLPRRVYTRKLRAPALDRKQAGDVPISRGYRPAELWDAALPKLFRGPERA